MNHNPTATNHPGRSCEPLKIEIRTSDGTSAMFRQTEKEQILTTMRLLCCPRLLSKAQLVLACDSAATAFPCRAVDMIVARTGDLAPALFPLETPLGILDIIETRGEEAGPTAGHSASQRSSGARKSVVTEVEVSTLGGWEVKLTVTAMTQSTVHDQLQSFAHLFDLPVLPFRLRTGGIGFLNPGNITRVDACPAPLAIPSNALPLELVHDRPDGPRTSQCSTRTACAP